jgi:DNA ligase-1
MRFKEFADTADEINDISGNIDSQEKVGQLIRDSGDDRTIVPRFIQGRIFPPYDNRKVSMSTSLLRTAISESTGVDESELDNKMPDVTDMGELFDVYDIDEDIGQQTLGSASLSVGDVYQTLESIAETSGSGSQQEKIDYVVSLISKSTSIEAKYLIRLILGKMSIGVGEGTVRKAISSEYNIEEDTVERAIMLATDTGRIASVAHEDGVEGLDALDISVGDVPIRPMKASKTKVKDVLEDIDEDYAYAEYKYDGFRIQAHKVGENVKLFTRRLEDVTSSLPDIVEFVKENVNAEEIILDGEVVGYESKNYETPLSYQDTQKRIRRKYGIDDMVDEIPVRPEFFDVLYNGEKGLLIDEELETRVKTLEESCTDSVLGRREKCRDVSSLQDVITQSEKDGHEGVMAKNPFSTYEPNSRGKRWLKIKPAGETVDAVVIGGEYGDGRRSDFIASYELGLWNQSEDELQSIGDVGTGFTDEQFESLTDTLEKEVTVQSGRDLEIRPVAVFEVEFEEVQPSPEYESGYGLRFPRFIRRRDTKDVDDADTIERLESIAETLN